MSNFGVRFVASPIPLRIFQGWKAEPKMEQVKRQYRHHPLQQFFTSFTNSNRPLGEQYKLAGQQSTVIKPFTPNQRWILPPSEIDQIKVFLFCIGHQANE